MQNNLGLIVKDTLNNTEIEKVIEQLINQGVDPFHLSFHIEGQIRLLCMKYKAKKDIGNAK